MNFSDFIKDNGKRVSKEHYLHLVQVSRADGKINPEELELLHKEGNSALPIPKLTGLLNRKPNIITILLTAFMTSLNIFIMLLR